MHEKNTERQTDQHTQSFSDKSEANSQCNESSSTTASHGVPVGEAENSYCWNLQMTETQKAEKDKINKMHDSVTKGIIRGGRREGKTDKVKQRWRKRRGESILLLCLKQISKHWSSFSEQVIVLAQCYRADIRFTGTLITQAKSSKSHRRQSIKQMKKTQWISTHLSFKWPRWLVLSSSLSCSSYSWTNTF